MSADFDKPGLDDPYTEVLPDIRDNQKSLATMFNTGAAFNTPLNAVQFLGGKFALFNGASFDITPVAVGGGGTGATTAAGARTNLSLSSISEANALYLKALSNGSDINNASTFRTNIDVPSNSEAALNTDNLSNLANASSSFSNIKQTATESSTGVVEEATAAEMRSGEGGKFPDAQTIVADRTPQLIWTGSATTVTIAAILSDTGFIVVPGVYYVNSVGEDYILSVRSVSEISNGTSKAFLTANILSVITSRFSTSDFIVRVSKNGEASSTDRTITEIFFTPL